MEIINYDRENKKTLEQLEYNKEVSCSSWCCCCYPLAYLMDNLKKKKTIHELAKANPDKSYRELEQEKAEQATYENNGGLVIDDTNECESWQ